MRSIKNIVLILSLIAMSLFSAEECLAQKYPERRTARQGNEQYDSGDFSAAEIQYRKAIEQNNALYEATFNLGDALYRQQRHADAAKLFGNIAADSLRTEDQKAEALFNMGNSYFGERKFEEAIEAYKSSLRLKPDDVECKFNLAYAQKMLQHQQQQQQQQDNQEQNQDQQEQNKEQNKDQNQDQNKDQQNDQDKQDQQDKQDDRDQQNKDQEGDGNKEPQPQNNQPKEEPQNSPKGNAPQPRMSQQEAEQLLQAVQGEEDKTRDKMDRQRGVAVGRSGKNW